MDQGYTYGWEAGYTRNRSAAADDDDDEHSDDGPLLAYKYDKHRDYTESTSERGAGRRRSTLGLVVRFSLFSTAMILFCVLLYIPMYSRVIHRVPKDIVAGWPVHTNRDTKVYVQPNNITTLHEPKHICSKSEKKKNKLFLLIVVCSSTSNFERRVAIRETWGSYKNYLELTKLYATTKERYKNYNYTYDLYPEPTIITINSTEELNRTKRDAGFSALLPKLAEAIKNMQQNEKTDTATEEKRFEDENENNFKEFDMNKELDNNNQELQQQDYDYDYPSNVMKIPPNGYVDTPDIEKVLNMLKKQKLNIQPEEPKREEIKLPDDIELDFKLTFLLGLPPQDNSTDVQSKIEEEVERYGDIIQENFVDSYNNLTLKSIMMLKWVTNHCTADLLRYILKTDDDMYINVPRLMVTLHNASLEHERRSSEGHKEEYLLAGDLIHGAKPVLDASNKWFSPRYMYGGRIYPRYLSGTGYALSLPAARALYEAALDTPYFHLEDVYITGICALRSKPRIRPQWSFSQHLARTAQPCDAYSHVKVHRVPPRTMRMLHEGLLQADTVDRCERIRLTQVRRDRLRPKTQPKTLNKLVRTMT